MIKKFFEKFNAFKHKELLFIVIIIVAIILVFVLSDISATKTSVDLSSLSQSERLEYQIIQAVNAISGDDNSTVVVVWEKISDEKNSNVVGSIFQTNTNENNSVKSVAVVCKSGNEAKVKVDVTLMLCSLLNIDESRIFVSSKK